MSTIKTQDANSYMDYLLAARGNLTECLKNYDDPSCRVHDSLEVLNQTIEVLNECADFTRK